MFDLKKDLKIYTSKVYEDLIDDILSLDKYEDYYKIKLSPSLIKYYFFKQFDLKLKFRSKSITREIIDKINSSNLVIFKVSEKDNDLLFYCYGSLTLYDTLYRRMYRNYSAKSNNKNNVSDFSIEFSFALKPEKKLLDNYIRIKKLPMKLIFSFLLMRLDVSLLVDKVLFESVKEKEHPKRKFNDMFFSDACMLNKYICGGNKGGYFFKNNNSAILMDFVLLGINKLDQINKSSKYKFNDDLVSDFGLKNVEDAEYFFELLEEMASRKIDFEHKYKYPNLRFKFLRNKTLKNLYNKYLLNKYVDIIYNIIYDLDFLLYINNGDVIKRDMEEKVFLKKYLENFIK